MIETMDCWTKGLSDCDCVRTEFTEHASRITPLIHHSITPFFARA